MHAVKVMADRRVERHKAMHERHAQDDGEPSAKSVEKQRKQRTTNKKSTNKQPRSTAKSSSDARAMKSSARKSRKTTAENASSIKNENKKAQRSGKVAEDVAADEAKPTNKGKNKNPATKATSSTSKSTKNLSAAQLRANEELEEAIAAGKVRISFAIQKNLTDRTNSLRD